MEFNTQLLVAVFVSVLLGWLVSSAISWYRKFRDEKEHDYPWMVQFIEAACQVAERVYDGDGRGKEKLAWVLGVVQVEVEKYGITFDVDQVTAIVDKYVHEVLNAGKE